MKDKKIIKNLACGDGLSRRLAPSQLRPGPQVRSASQQVSGPTPMAEQSERRCPPPHNPLRPRACSASQRVSAPVSGPTTTQAEQRERPPADLPLVPPPRQSRGTSVVAAATAAAPFLETFNTTPPTQQHVCRRSAAPAAARALRRQQPRHRNPTAPPPLPPLQPTCSLFNYDECTGEEKLIGNTGGACIFYVRTCNFTKENGIITIY